MKIEEKYNNLNRIISWIQNCDTKASIILTLQGVIITILFTSNLVNYFSNTLSREFNWVFDLPSISCFIEGVVLIAFLIIALIEFYYTIQVLYARLDPKVYKEEGLKTDSSIFFGTISAMNFSDFSRKINEATNEESDIESQIFINSKICDLKFKNYNLSIKYLKRFVVLGVIYGILVILNGG